MSVARPNQIQPQVQAALAASAQLELRQVVVEQRGKALVLRGTVSSFYHKQLAQEVVKSVCKETKLINAIRVR